MINSNKQICLIISFVLVLFSCSQADSDKAFVKNYINEQQNKIGVQCNDLYENAIQFLNKEVSKLIQSCKNGEDGISLYRNSLYQDINEFEEKLGVCWLCKTNADRVGIKMEGYYEELRHLFDLLDHAMTQYGDDPPSIQNLSPSTFLKIEDYYKFFIAPSDSALSELKKIDLKKPPAWIEKNKADIPVEKWHNKKFIFLEQPKSSQKYGYTTFRLDQNDHFLCNPTDLVNEVTCSLKYEKFVGKIICVTNVKKMGDSFLIEFEEEETKRKIYAETYKGYIHGIGYLKDLHDAKTRWYEKTIYSKLTSLNKYDPETDKCGSINIEIGQPLKVIDVTLGFYEPIRLYCETQRGQIGYIITAYSWTNQRYDDWADMRPWEFRFFEKYPVGDVWNEDNWDSIKNGEIKVGMTKEQVLISWPKPGRKIKKDAPNSNEEIWLYTSKELHFVDNILASINPRK